MNFREFIKKQPILSVIHNLVSSLNTEAWWVGGGVRDYLLSYPVKDYDITVRSHLMEIGENLASALNAKIQMTSEFETVKLRLKDGTELDIARMRKEVYPHPGALPVVKPADSIEEDLQRRDFTINAIAVSLSKAFLGDIVDPLKGLEDIKKKVLNVTYEHSFRDDPTRAFRAIRYRVRLGFSYAPRMEREFKSARENLNFLSFERIKNELKKISSEEKRREMFTELAERKLLLPIGIHPPDISSIELLERIIKTRKKEDWIAFFSLFILNTPEIDIANFTLTRKERKILQEIIAFDKIPLGETLEDIHGILKKTDDLTLNILSATRSDCRGLLTEYINRRKNVKLELTGRDLQKLGIKEGKEIEKMKDKLLVLRMEGKIRSKKEEEDFVEEYIRHSEEHLQD